VVIDEISVIGSRCGPFPEAIRALEKKSVDVAGLISLRVRIEDGVEAMNVATRSGVVKVLLTFE
jgi:threonine dehydrogenase-like Zn-dependent dehydrogenase